MKIYATSKNTGPSWSNDPVHLLYLGTSIKEAEKAVGEFAKYEIDETDFPTRFIYSALPRSVIHQIARFYTADGYWFSIAEFELEEA